MRQGEILHEIDAKSPLQSLGNSPGIDLKTVKYKPLPSITASPNNGTSLPISGVATEEKKEPPAPVIYFVGIRAQSHSVDEFRSIFGQYETFFRSKRTGYSVGPNADVVNTN